MTEQSNTAAHTSGAPRTRSARSRPTVRAVLSAAAEVFTEKGFETAGIAELVERSGVSVGSIYHHFGGKAEVFGALCDEFHQRMRARTEEGSGAARAAGAEEPLEIYLAGARAYLEGCWQERELTRLFHGGDGPPWLWSLHQERVISWTQTNMELLGTGPQPYGRSLAHAVTALVAACALELTEIASAEEADGLIGFYLDLVGRAAAPHLPDAPHTEGTAHTEV
ncbi:TetR/AcrR family transcriptional regulator [Brevibacterium album]|uniref:TetR/AcrR family transcriptional regulator n=1 Tax=Brevibacterium album TaxID=417948 RepID=UPI0003FE44D0|nr:TetR/AcrR family transcriptional regulator [Brevibacterium album]